MLQAKALGKVLGSPEDVGLVGLRWFRAKEGGSFDQLADVKGSTMQPSVDDAGCRLCVQCYDLKDEAQSHFAEFGPIALDPKTRDAALAKKVSLKAITMDMSDLYLEREDDGPVTLRDASSGTSETPVDPQAWHLVPSEPKKVMYGHREMYFASHLDRDVATVLVRSLCTPQTSRSTSPIPSSLSAASSAHPALLPTNIDEAMQRIQFLEKQLNDTQIQLATAMAAKARSGVAETGKALAEATSLRREVERLKAENISLASSLSTLRSNRAQLETDLAAALERDKTRDVIVHDRDEARALLKEERCDYFRFTLFFWLIVDIFHVCICCTGKRPSTLWNAWSMPNAHLMSSKSLRRCCADEPNGQKRL